MLINKIKSTKKSVDVKDIIPFKIDRTRKISNTTIGTFFLKLCKGMLFKFIMPISNTTRKNPIAVIVKNPNTMDRKSHITVNRKNRINVNSKELLRLYQHFIIEKIFPLDIHRNKYMSFLTFKLLPSFSRSNKAIRKFVVLNSKMLTHNYMHGIFEKLASKPVIKANAFKKVDELFLPGDDRERTEIPKDYWPRIRAILYFMKYFTIWAGLYFKNRANELATLKNLIAQRNLHFLNLGPIYQNILNQWLENYHPHGIVYPGIEAPYIDVPAPEFGLPGIDVPEFDYPGIDASVIHAPARNYFWQETIVWQQFSRNCFYYYLFEYIPALTVHMRGYPFNFVYYTQIFFQLLPESISSDAISLLRMLSPSFGFFVPGDSNYSMYSYFILALLIEEGLFTPGMVPIFLVLDNYFSSHSLVNKPSNVSSPLYGMIISTDDVKILRGQSYLSTDDLRLVDGKQAPEEHLRIEDTFLPIGFTLPINITLPDMLTQSINFTLWDNSFYLDYDFDTYHTNESLTNLPSEFEPVIDPAPELDIHIY